MACHIEVLLQLKVEHCAQKDSHSMLAICYLPD